MTFLKNPRNEKGSDPAGGRETKVSDYVRFWPCVANLCIACNHFFRLRLSRTYCSKRVPRFLFAGNSLKNPVATSGLARLLTSIAFHSYSFPSTRISWLSNCISGAFDTTCQSNTVIGLVSISSPLTVILPSYISSFLLPSRCFSGKLTFRVELLRISSIIWIFEYQISMFRILSFSVNWWIVLHNFSINNDVSSSRYKLLFPRASRSSVSRLDRFSGFFQFSCT